MILKMMCVYTYWYIRLYNIYFLIPIAIVLDNFTKEFNQQNFEICKWLGIFVHFRTTDSNIWHQCSSFKYLLHKGLCTSGRLFHFEQKGPCNCPVRLQCLVSHGKYMSSTQFPLQTLHSNLSPDRSHTTCKMVRWSHIGRMSEVGDSSLACLWLPLKTKERSN